MICVIDRQVAFREATGSIRVGQRWSRFPFELAHACAAFAHYSSYFNLSSIAWRSHRTRSYSISSNIPTMTHPINAPIMRKQKRFMFGTYTQKWRRAPNQTPVAVRTSRIRQGTRPGFERPALRRCDSPADKHLPSDSRSTCCPSQNPCYATKRRAQRFLGHSSA
jgi:hypothetical protein